MGEVVGALFLASAAGDKGKRKVRVRKRALVFMASFYLAYYGLKGK
jgi:hypothetical protein